MPRTRTTRPIESFGPHILQALLEGSKRELKLTMPYTKAAYFRHRANELRAEMRRQKHPQYTMAAQARLTITWPPDTPVNVSRRNVKTPKDPNTEVTLVISPADEEFAEVLAKAGVQVPELNDTGIAPEGESSDILEDYLKG